MKRVMLVLLLTCSFAASAWSSQMNVDPYFEVGTTAMIVDVAGETSSAPSFYMTAGSALNWISEDLMAEVRLGFGGQYNTFNGDLNLYTSYLLKPNFEVTKQFAVYLIAGVTTVSVSISSQNFSDTALSYGAGFVYHVPHESLSMVGEWMQYHDNTNNSTTDISGMDISGVSLGFKFAYY